MDLTNQPVINTEIQEDELTGLSTVTVKDSADTTVLGTIVIESSKLRALMTSLQFMAKALPRHGDVLRCGHELPDQAEEGED